MTYRYCYAICRADASAPTEARPVGGEGAFGVTAIGSVGLLTAPIADDEVMSTRRNMLAHTKALEEAMRTGPILPFRFGVIAPEDGRIEGLLGASEADLAAQLDALEGKIEVGVRVSWDRAAVMTRIVQDDPALREAYRGFQGKDETATRMARVELGRAVHDRLATRREAERARYEEALSAVCEEFIVTEDTDEMTVLNAACLVASEDEAALSAAVEAIDAGDPDLYAIRYLSPVPPFNFVRLDLGEAAMAA